MHEEPSQWIAFYMGLPQLLKQLVTIKLFVHLQQKGFPDNYYLLTEIA